VGKSNKEKMMAAMKTIQPEISKPITTAKEAAKKYHRLSFSVNLEEKMVDGKKVISGNFSCYDYATPELKEEFTDMEKLKEKVNQQLDEFNKALIKGK
jgi:hypothetical protein